MRRVHRNLSREDIQALRVKLMEWVPQEKAAIPELLRTMRLITRMSQTEYARFCNVAPRVLADLESDKGNARVGTLQKLFSPFGLKVGVVAQPLPEWDVRLKFGQSRRQIIAP
jgi:hypothetical protein